MNIKVIFSICIFMLISKGSYSNTTNKEQTTTSFMEVYDPWYGLNKRMYTFNYYADKYGILPVADFYKNIVPIVGQKGITNFYTNLSYIETVTSATLQGKIAKGMRGLGRLSINSILGLGGLFDVAEKLEMPQENEDFGLLLANYGVGAGPYLIVPFMGPSNLRDLLGKGMGLSLGIFTSPLSSIYIGSYPSMGAFAIESINWRNEIKFRHYGTSTPFEYEYLRFYYNEIRYLEENADKKEN